MVTCGLINVIRATGKTADDEHCVKSLRVWSFSDPYFSASGVNTERYSVSLRIHSEYGKIRTLYTHTGSKTRKRREEITSEKKPIHVPPKVLKFAVESFQVFFIKLDFRKNRCCSYNTYKNKIIIHLSFISTEAVIQKCSVKKVLRKIHRKTKLSASTLLKRDSDTGVFFL